MGMRVTDAVWDLGCRLAPRNLGWFEALREVANSPTGDLPVSYVVLQHARRELGDAWASKVYDAARTSTGLYIDDDPTEPGEAGGTSVNELIRRLSSARDADPAIGALKVVIGHGRVDLERVDVVLDHRSDSGRLVMALRGDA